MTVIAPFSHRYILTSCQNNDIENIVKYPSPHKLCERVTGIISVHNSLIYVTKQTLSRSVMSIHPPASDSAKLIVAMVQEVNATIVGDHYVY